jgi:hypothetical protein
MSKRKTIKMDEIKDFANLMLRGESSNEFINSEVKKGIILMIEKALHNANAYEGFMFNNIEDCEFNTPGYYNRKYF